MILVNTDFVTGKTVNTISIVKGSMIQSKHVGRDIMSSLKSLVGGELTSYSEMINEARANATKRMVEEAEKLNADAIINIRYSSSAVTQGAAEILVVGTAVNFI
ncbi:YbjQ family protein [bacterium]|nr:YbjQ family protein [bacterium]